MDFGHRQNGSVLLHLGSDDEGEEEEENKEALKKLLEKMKSKKSRLEDDDEDTFFSGRLSYDEEDELPLPPPKLQESTEFDDLLGKRDIYDDM